MKKTLLLCFIHGFKGGDDTFGRFPEDLRALVSLDLPKVDVRAIVYPKFETRGDLAECVGRFREWLLEKVIDLEVSKHTPSPTVEPSVHTILIGHSMGGIVASDALLAIASDVVITSSSRPSSSSSDKTKTHPHPQAQAPPPPPPLNSLMFPYIAAVLAFDTPYLGISPGVVAHGAEEHYNAATAAIGQLSALTGGLWGSGSKGASPSTSGTDPKKGPMAQLPAPSPAPSPSPSPSPSNHAQPARPKWATFAGYALASAALAGGSIAAYQNRDALLSGGTWVQSHLEFVGCLVRGEELQRRVKSTVALERELGVGWANLYTRLGKRGAPTAVVGGVMGERRTFCNLPRKESRAFWDEAVNDAASDEIRAHMTMFFPKDNPGYFVLIEQARQRIVKWTTNDWYESSTKDVDEIEMEHEHKGL